LNNGGGVAPPEVEVQIFFIMAAMLYDLLNESPNLKIEISLANLIEAINYSVKSTHKELEKLVQDSSQETYISPKKASELLDCDLSTLWRWNKSNYLKSIELGGERRYKMSDLKRILEGGR
jgi:hypothetical protein